jgi:hypothetical protein
MKLAMRLHVDLGPAEAQQLLRETCCKEIHDLPAYFRGTPNQISPGSTWAFLRETWAIDISRHDLKTRRPPPHRDPPPKPEKNDPQKPNSPATLTLEQIRERLHQAVIVGASRQELEALVLELADLSDRSAYDLRNLLRTIQAEQDAAQAIAAEVATIKAAADRRDLGQALTLEAFEVIGPVAQRGNRGGKSRRGGDDGGQRRERRPAPVAPGTQRRDQSEGGQPGVRGRAITRPSR